MNRVDNGRETWKDFDSSGWFRVGIVNAPNSILDHFVNHGA